MLFRCRTTCQSRRDEFLGLQEGRNPSGMGLLTGLVLGAGMWAAILAVASVIRL